MLANKRSWDPWLKRFGKPRSEVTAREWRDKYFAPMSGREFMGHWECRVYNATQSYLGLTDAYIEALTSLYETKKAQLERERKEQRLELGREREAERKRAREAAANTEFEVVAIELGRGAKRKVRVAKSKGGVERQSSDLWVTGP